MVTCTLNVCRLCCFIAGYSVEGPWWRSGERFESWQSQLSRTVEDVIRMLILRGVAEHSFATAPANLLNSSPLL